MPSFGCFPQLLDGGRTELRFDSEDILTAGVAIIAQPLGVYRIVAVDLEAMPD
ncbi:MAG: hypothetical protein R8K47_04665 [Mariprofundaceae bacterium]